MSNVAVIVRRGISIAAGAVALVAFGAAAGYLFFVREIDGDIGRLISAARPSGMIVTEAMLQDLPPPAQRYLRYAGIVGRSIPRFVHVTQKGRLRASVTDGWMGFEADETYSLVPPGFIWRAWLPGRTMPLVLGRDEYLEGAGSIRMKMLAWVPVAEESGSDLAAAGLMRFLNETMWFPAALLAPAVTLVPMDDQSFVARLSDRGMLAEGRFFIDAEGRLVNFEATRFDTATRRLETWQTPVGSYRTLDGLNLPSSGTAVWKRADGDFTYIELELTGLRHED